jgi:catechol 2,3-dioxygenase-like lactoylglutathione lyase family enzyme
MNPHFYGPVIFAEDLNRSKQFYMNIMGQEIEHDFGANVIFKSHLSIWKVGSGHEISALTAEGKKSNTFELYFETGNIHELASHLKESGVPLLHDIKTEPWGQRTIRFFDPDDNLVEAGEELHVFVKRIYHETVSVTETFRITGVPEELIKEMVKS